MPKSLLIISRQAPWSGLGAREALDIALAGGAFDILLPAGADLHFAKIRVFHGQILAHEPQPAADFAIRVAGLAAAQGIFNA